MVISSIRKVCLILSFIFCFSMGVNGSHTMNWNIVDIQQAGTATGGIDITVTLGFCDGWCTGSAITCCGGLHDVYIRITQVTGDCAICPTGGVPTIIGPIDAGYVGPPYSATNPNLPACPANLGDAGNVEIPFNFEGCPGEEYRVEILALNRSTLNSCGGLSAIPNVCTSGCNFSTFTDWLPAVSADSPGGVFTVPGMPLAPVLIIDTPVTDVTLSCGSPAGSFPVSFETTTCRDVPGTSLEYTYTILSGPPCVSLANATASPTPCMSSIDPPFMASFEIMYPGFPDVCGAMAPCGGDGTYPIQVEIMTEDLCTNETVTEIVNLTLIVEGEASAVCFDYADTCEGAEDDGLIPYTGPVQPAGSFSMTPAGPATITPGGQIDVSSIPCGGPEATYTITFTPTDPSACSAMDEFTYTPPPCPGSPIVEGNICEGEPVVPISISCLGCPAGSTLAVTWWNAPSGGTQQFTGASFTAVSGTSLALEGTFDANTAGVYTFFAACECDGCSSERVPVTITVGESSSIPSSISINGECKSLGEVDNSRVFSRDVLFPGSSPGGTFITTVVDPYTASAAASSVGDGTVILAGAACFEITYDLGTAECVMGDAMATAYIQCGVVPEPFFSIMDKACYNGTPFNMTPFIQPVDYNLADPSLLTETWLITGPGSIVDPVTGEMMVTGAGTIELTYTVSFMMPACGPFPAAECVESFVVEIVIEDGENVDASFTADIENPCIGESVTLTAVTPGGIFTGTNVIDNNDGTASYTPTECGLNIATYTITQGGCTSAFSLPIETDKELPVLIPPPTGTAADCVAEIPNINTWLAMASATDNCPGVVLTSSLFLEVQQCGNTKSFIYEFTATDACGNTVSETSTYSLVDFIVPTVITPATDLIIECNPGTHTTLINDWIINNGNASATDGCGDVSWTHDYQGLGALALDCGLNTGEVAVTFTVTDDCGNLTTTMASIIIEDNTPPVIMCPEDLVLECGDPNNAAIINNWLATANAFDNCDFNTTLTNDFALPANMCEGDPPLVVTFTAEDACGNDINCTASILIIDTTPPVVVIPPSDITVECDGAGNAAELAAWIAANGNAVVSDDCSAMVTVTPEMVGDNPGCGNTDMITYNFRFIDDCNNEISATADFIILDTEPPSFIAPADATFVCDGSGNMADIDAWLLGVTMIDDVCDAGTVIVSSELFNSISDCGGAFSETYQFIAVDDCGNISTELATVSITDTALPTIACPADLVLECGAINNDLLIINWLNSATTMDDCSEVLVSNNFNGTLPAVSCDGTTGTTVVFTATDDCGNLITCSADIIIEDNIAPVFLNCPTADITVNVDVNQCDANVVYSLPVIMDDCDDEITLIAGAGNIDSGSEFPVGSTTLSFTASDACGNVSLVCSFTVTVVDSEVPTLSCPSNTVEVCNDTGLCTWASDVAVVPTFNENCMGDMLTHTIVSADGSIDATDAAGTVALGTLFPLGTSTITYDLEDAEGNMTSCSFSVIVNDCEAPILNCPAPGTAECDGTGNMADVDAWVAASIAAAEGASTDNCDMAVMVTAQEFNNISACGNTFTVVYQFTATDAAGNTSICFSEFTVTDLTPPSITAIPDVDEHCENAILEFYAWLSANGNATAVDLCSNVSWTNDYDGSSLDDICEDEVLVTFTATDECGNAVTTSATYRIHDDEVPVIIAPVDITLECNDPANDAILATWLQSYVASDNCSNVTVVNDDPVLPTTCVVGSNSVTVMFMATDDCGNFDLDQATITIEDNTAPTIMVDASDIILECGDGNNTALIDAWTMANGLAMATDECTAIADLDWTAVVGTPVTGCGLSTTTPVTFTVEDECGNSKTTIANIVIVDTTAPMITMLPADVTVECNDPAALTLADWQAMFATSDDCGTVTPAIQVWNTISACGGTNATTYLFTATDQCGNQTTDLATFTIQDTGLPTIMCPVPLSLECGDPNNSLLIIEWLNSATAEDELGCSNVTITNDFAGGLPSLTCLAGTPVLVTFTATDDCGNEMDCMSTITLDDTEAPIFVNCPTNITVNVDADLCSANVIYSTPVANDLCNNNVTVTADPANIPSGGIFPLGTSTIRYTADDGCNTMICTFTITVEDSTVPTIGCPGNITTCNASGTCTWPSDASTNPIGLENCPDAIVSHNIVSADGSIDVLGGLDEVPVGTLFPLGTSTVTYIIVDDSGNSSSCSFQVIVEDCEAPMIMCTDELNVACGAEDIATWIASIEATATDMCSAVTTSNMLVTDFSSCGGTVNQTYLFTVTDAAGNSSTCLATYMSEDLIPPVLTAAIDETIECDGSNQSTALQAWLNNNGGATGTDACSEPLVWTNDFVGDLTTDCGSAGNVEVEFTATDACGNSSVTSAVFRIEDTTIPVIACPSPIVLECGSDVNDAIIESWLNGAQSIDACDGSLAVTNDYDDVFAPGCGLTGVYTVTFTTVDACGNMTSCTSTITLEDTTAPTIEIEAQDLILECADGNNATLIAAWIANNGGAVASDACSVTNPLTDWSEMEGAAIASCGANTSTSYVFTVTDDCGNTSTTSASVIIGDTTPPELTLPADITVECNAPGETTLLDWQSTAMVADDCGTPMPITSELWNTISGCGGTMTEQYIFTATDDCGNETTGIASYTIADREEPTIVCPMPLSLECGNPDNNLLILQWLEAATATDEFDCSAVTITHDYPGGLPSLTCLGGAPVMVTFTATDDCGNEIDCVSTITMDDTVAPTFVNCPGDMTVNVDVDLCTSNVIYSTPIANDLCNNNVTVTADPANIPSGGIFPLGETTISFTADDGCNTMICTFTITVEDSEIPTIACPSNAVVVCNASGTCTWPSDASTNPIGVENCPGATVTHDIVSADGSIDVVGAADEVPAGTLFPLGTSTVTYTIVDGMGNMSMCSFQVIVEDCEAPMIICSDEINVACGAEDIDGWFAGIAATATDNCDLLADLVVDTLLLTDFSSCGGTFERVYLLTVTDQAGNSSSCTATYETDDEVPPVIMPMAMDLTLECDGSNQAAELQNWLLSNGGANATDACSGPVVWTNDFVGDLLTDCGAPGVDVTFTATDACGNISTTVATFTIEDNGMPVLDCPANIVLECSDPINDAVIENWLNGASSLDACQGILPVTNDFDDVFTAACGETGFYTVTFTSIDQCDNVTTCVRTITLIDSTPPTIEMAATDLVLECADGGNGAAITAWEMANGNALASDECSEPLTWDFTTIVLTACGITTETIYTFSVTDECDNISTTEASVIISDTTPPVLTVPGDVTVECADPTEITLLDWQATATVTDDCGTPMDIDAVLFNTISACGDTNTEVYLFTATDACGNISTGMASYTIEDTTEPVITVNPEDFVGECNGSSNSVDILSWLNNNGFAEAEDLCGDITWTNDYGTIVTDCGTTGEVIVTFTATDDCGNSSSAPATFSIDDNVAPSWELDPQNLTILCDGSSDPLGEIDAWLSTVGGGEAEDSCSLVIYTNDFTALAGGCSSFTGSATVTFTASDACGNMSIRMADVEIIDELGPEILSPAKDTLVECNPATVTIDSLSWIANNGGAIAEDNCSGIEMWTHALMDVIEGCGPTATYRYMFFATDTCGNESAVTIADFVVEDTTPPVIDPTAVNQTVECDGSGNDMMIDTWLANVAASGASDVCSGFNLTWEWDLVMDEDSCGITGIQVYRFTVFDECLNSSTTEGTFTIEDTTPPLITGGMDVSGECDQSGAGNDDELISWLNNNAGAMAEDVCGTFTWSNDFDVANWVDGCNDSRSVDVEFTATDACGNSSSVIFTFSTGDLTPPEFLNCPAAPIVVDAPATWCSAFVNFPDLIATDNCGSPVVTQVDNTGLSSGDLFPVGLTILTFQAEDDCGNISLCEIKIIVNDFHTPPTIVCPEDVVMDNDADMCGAVVNNIAPVSFEDNCIDNVVIVYEAIDVNGNIIACGFEDASGIKFPEGVNTLTYNIYDQPLLLITEVIQDGSTTGVEITNFGPASLDLSCMDISREGPDMETYNVPNGTVLGVGDVYTQIFTDITTATPAGYYLSFVGTSIDGVAVNGYIPTNFDWAGIINASNIYRDQVCDHDDNTDWSVVGACNGASFGMLNPGLPVMPDNGTTVGLQESNANTESCTTTITVTDTEAPYCAEHDTTNYLALVPLDIIPGVCGQLTFNVTSNLIVGDINIIDLQGTVADAGGLAATLISPAGTSVNLFSSLCTGTADIDISLDDSAANNLSAITCSPLGGSDMYQPLESFKAFYGEDAMGTWTLEISTSDLNPAQITNVELQVLTLQPWTQIDVTIPNDMGMCDAMFTWTPPIFGDNCCAGIITVEYTTEDDIAIPSSGSVMQGIPITETFGVGTTTITYTLMDQFGNTSMCSFDVTVEDTEDPVLDPLTCVDQVIQLMPGECTFPLNQLLLPDFADNCGIDSIAYMPAIDQGLPIGETEVTITAFDAAGNSVSCTFTVTVLEFIPDSDQLACNNQINLSLGPDCMAVITADMILEGDSYGCFDEYCITLTDANGNFIGSSVDGTNVLDITHIDQIITVEICTDCDGGNCCTGSILVENKLIPEVVCPPDTVINCNHSFDPINTGMPIVESCEDELFINYYDDFENLGMCEDPSARIVRTWSVIDESNNFVECVQIITIKDFDVNDIAYPDNLILTEDYGCDHIDENPELTHPDNTGFPTISGIPVYETGEGLCSHFWNWDDQILYNCEGSYEILRKWIIRDMCEEIIPGVNPVEHYQSIKVLDRIPPIITDCPDDIVISADPWNCYATIYLNDYMPTIKDYCGSVKDTFVSVTPGTVFEEPIGSGNFYLSKLDIGDHEVKIKVKDQCSNYSECKFNIEVRDFAAPNVVCKGAITVSLTTNGLAKLYPESIDLGSTDNCSPVHFQVYRQEEPCGFPQDTIPGEFVHLCCADIGDDPVKVVLRVWDDANMDGVFGTFGDNYSECWTNVTVEDKAAPGVICPVDVTITCDQDYTNLALTGAPSLTTICEFADAEYTDNLDGYNECGTGVIIRRWNIVDAGNIVCQQLIHVEAFEPFTGENIIWPEDYAGNCLEDIPDSEPWFTGGSCDLLGINLESDTFFFESDACYKILNEWTIIDWCQYDATNPSAGGIWSDTQVIKILDNEGPMIACDTMFIESFDEDCILDQLVVIGSATDNNCGLGPQLQWYYQIDLDYDGTYDQSGELEGTSPSFTVNNVSLGTAIVNWVVTDGCGNNSQCTQVIRIVDAKPPTPYCIALSTSLGETGEVELWASDFDQGGLDNCTLQDQIIISFTEDGNSPNRIFTCDDIPNGVAAMVPVNIWYIDKDGNADFCVTTLTVRDTENVCEDQEGAIATVEGRVATELDEGVTGVEITLTDIELSESDDVKTIADGTYDFESTFAVGLDYSLSAYRNDDHLNGVSTLDVFKMQRHVLGLESLDSPYKVIAADINNSESLSAVDLVELQKMILGYNEEFPDNNSWRFVASDFEFVSNDNPWPFSEVRAINPLEFDLLAEDFVGVKIGDVNNTAEPQFGSNIISSTRGINELTFIMEQENLIAGNQYIIPVKVHDTRLVTAFQGTFKINVEKAEILSISSESLEMDRFNFGTDEAMKNGLIPFLWTNPYQRALGDDEYIMIEVAIKEDVSNSELITLNSDHTPVIAYFNDGAVEDIEDAIIIKSVERENAIFYVGQNTPNPFSKETLLEIIMPEDGSVELKIFDPLSRLIENVSYDLQEGRNEIKITDFELNNAGVYVYKVVYGNDAYEYKMIYVK